MQRVYWMPGMSISAVESQIIRAAMDYFKQNKTSTAKSLGISIRTLDAKLDKMRLEDEAEEQRKMEAQRKREDFLNRSRGIPAGAQPANPGSVLR